MKAQKKVNPKNLDKLRAKKKWTAEEVGKVLIASILYDIENMGDPDHEPLLPPDEYHAREKELVTSKDIETFMVYKRIYDLLIDVSYKGQANSQQFYNGFHRYLLAFNEVMTTDESLAELTGYPLIMTAEQYRDTEEKALQWYRAKKISYYDLLSSLIGEYFVAVDEEADNIPAKIDKAIIDASNEPATNQKLLNNYCEELGLGYYTLPDGRRSDEMDRSEWKDAVRALFLEHYKLKINGRPASKEESYRYFQQENLLATYKLFFEGEDAIKKAYKEKTGRELSIDARALTALLDSIITGEETPKGYHHIVNELQTAMFGRPLVVWHSSASEVSKYSILRIPNSYNQPNRPQKEQLEEFKKDYPALYEALDAYIRETIPTAKDLKPAQLFNECITFGELIDNEILGYDSFQLTRSIIADYLLSSGTSYLDTQRVRYAGVAISEEPSKTQLTASGAFKDNFLPLRRFESLETLAKSDQQTSELERFRSSLFIPALRSIYGYNALLSIIGEVYGIDGIEKAYIKDTKVIESQLDGYNNLFYFFYFNVYGSEEEKAEKRALIKKLFSTVDYRSLKPSEDSINAVKNLLEKEGDPARARQLLAKSDELMTLIVEGAGILE